MKPTIRTRVKPYLDDLKTRKATNREVAHALECSEEALCRTLKTMIQKDPPQDRQAEATLKAQRKAFRYEVANTMSIENAAKAANVSTRTIYRYIKK